MAARHTTRGLVLLLLAGIAACRPEAPPAPASSAAPAARHLVLITVDTLRADRLGSYGGTSVATPEFDRLAREGVRARDATAHAPITRPSHASLLTGRYPSAHGLRDNISMPLAAGVPTLAEQLAAQGFQTAAFVSSVVLARQSGLDRGFEHFDDALEAGRGDDVLFLNTLQRRGDDTVARAETWLDARPPGDRDRRLALWVHLYDPHDPYEPPEPYASRYRDQPYDGEVAWTDAVVGRLRTALERRQLWQEALVVLLADHGEALGEHGETGHGFFTYESTLRIPLIVRGPGVRQNGIIEGTVRTIDVMPTILDVLGIAHADLGLAGESFAGALGSQAPAPLERTTYAESLTPLVHYGWSDLRVLRDGRWKYILAPRPELYDLEDDPGELRNLADTQAARARALRAALEQMLRQEREQEQAGAGGTSAVSPELLEKLGALGYVSPGGAGATTAAGADPKDKVEAFKTLNGLMRDGLTLLRQGQYAQADDRLARLEREGAGGFQVYFYRGRALLGLGRTREAEASFGRAVQAMPSFTPASLALADARMARRDWRGTLEAIARGRETAPADARLLDREGQAWQQLGEREKALQAYDEVMRLAPKDALVRWRAGELLLDDGRTDRALTLFREATALDATVPDYWNSLGMVLGGAGKFDEAEQAFRAAVQRAPDNARYTYNLGLALLRQQNAEARTLFERTLQLDPGFRPARERLREMGR